MARLERTIYRSRSASIVEVLTFGPEEIPVGLECVAFVRSGYFTRRGQSAGIVDVNYALIGGADECLLAGDSKHICACTVLRYTAFGAPPLRAGCAPASSHAFLMLAKLLSDASMRRGNPDVDVQGLLGQIRGEMPASYSFAHSRIVTEIRRFINDQAFRRLSLDTIGHQFYMSPFSVSRLFHRETGMRLRDYALRVRLRRALNLLMQTDKTLTSVALDFGFYDEPHFSKAFRSEFGISPHSVRKYCTRSDFS